MEPSARTLFKTVKSLKKCLNMLQVWPGHGAGSACGKALGAIPETTVGYELRYNNSLKSATSEDSFVKFILEGQPEPPLYFARMKRDNKMGPALIGGLPKAKRLTLNELENLSQRKNSVILDTRERNEYAAGHIPGSLLSPLNKQFNTVAGSYITEDEEIILLVDEHRVTEAVTDLYRIGLDNIAGFFTPRDFQMYKTKGSTLDTLEITDFDVTENLGNNEAVLDVRKASEYNDFHIVGAFNIAHTRLLPRINELPEEKKWYVHCQSGVRSAVAAALLKRAGFNVALIDDDIEKFKSKQTV
jgi:hydroxyacylglutathione hydrolase